MPVDRTKWSVSFLWDEIPSWPCPSCTDGVLKREPKPGAGPIQQETADSRKASDHPNYDVDWVKCTFAALLRCESCADLVLVAGSTEEVFVGSPADCNLESRFTPTLFSPAPPLFRMPAGCPPFVQKELRQAWNLFWVDNAACANRIRTAVELVLTDQGVRRFGRDKKGRRTPLTLHHRIELYKARDPRLAGEMMAVKWLGNAGSHGSGAVITERLFDGFDLLEHVLEEVYAKRTQKLARIQRELVRTKGRTPKKRVGSID